MLIYIVIIGIGSLLITVVNFVTDKDESNSRLDYYDENDIFIDFVRFCVFSRNLFVYKCPDQN